MVRWIYRCLNGWLDEWVDERLDGPTDICLDEWVDGSKCGRVEGWKGG
jgi:hypothetical protein